MENIYYISTVNTQHMRGPDVLLRPGYTWRHVLAVKRPSREARTQRPELFIIFTILLNILITTKNFIMFQVLM